MPQPDTPDHLNRTSVEQYTDDGWLRSITGPASVRSPEPDRAELDLVSIAEEQQRKVGCDIHEDLCSQLSGIGCITKMLESQLREDRQQEAKLLSVVTKMIARAGQTAQELAQELVPSLLEVHGLVGALRDLAERQQKRYGMSCMLKLGDIEPIGDLETIVSIQIYRITQEAVSNAIRHSDADRILISLSTSDNRIDLSVEDDGKGMTEDLVSIGMGLITMKRRAQLINAAFSIRASLGAGAAIHCSIPLNN